MSEVAAQGQEAQKEGGEYAKVEKQYNEVYNKLLAVFQTEKNLLGATKVPNDKVNDIVAELLQEQQDEVMATFKKELKGLMNTYSQFKKEIKALEEDLKKKITEKRKEFIKKANDVMAPIENIKTLERDFREGFEVIANGPNSLATPSLTQDTGEQA